MRGCNEDAGNLAVRRHPFRISASPALSSQLPLGNSEPSTAKNFPSTGNQRRTSLLAATWDSRRAWKARSAVLAWWEGFFQLSVDSVLTLETFVGHV